MTDEEIQEAVESLDDWSFAGSAIHRTITFKSFVDAFSFMSAIAIQAEKLDHHPDWLNSYNRVEIHLMTHSSGKVTDKDIELARIIDSTAARFVG